jgi:hypothetical protein
VGTDTVLLTFANQANGERTEVKPHTVVRNFLGEDFGEHVPDMRFAGIAEAE